ncbi:MAG TPA: efflux RND transporter periplasmic adaptor subunit, partial [Lamprocystis sp. (in: g-proteobacteria)]|nr:efflux RND transporter periplasmic adaptor subunit [Lamprocystis sp. (in: g-proteobacteria)]
MITSRATRQRRLLMLAAGLLAVGGCSEQVAVTDPIRPVLLTQVVAGTGAQTAVFPGEVKPRYESALAFRIGGKIVARAVDAGARVRQGEVLARLDPADVNLEARAAQAQATAAQTDYAFAKSELDRYETLLTQKFISASALDAKRNAMKASLAKLEQAKASLAVTQNQTAYATLVAPADGVITTVSAEAGQVVAAGQTVMRYARETEREVMIAVPEARIGELTGAPEIKVVLASVPDRPYRARVREVSPAVDPE